MTDDHARARKMLRAAVAEYQRDKTAVLAKRDAAIKAAHKSGLTQAQIVEESGYSRETVRLALLDPAAREAFRASRRKG